VKEMKEMKELYASVEEMPTASYRSPSLLNIRVNGFCSTSLRVSSWLDEASLQVKFLLVALDLPATAGECETVVRNSLLFS
jgi:hypothetical protein